MIHENPKDASSQPGLSASSNGESELVRLRQECERLRQALAESEKERKDTLHAFYSYMREHVTEEEKAEAEKYYREVLENGGVDFRSALEELKRAHST